MKHLLGPVEVPVRLTVVVPMYNAESHLSDCLDSLLAQDMGEDEYEIVCVDDGSTDRTADLARSYSMRHINVVVHEQTNGGEGNAFFCP